MISPLIRIILADDSVSDAYFFQAVLNKLPFYTQLSVFETGEELMRHLNENSASMPDVLFLDMNLPRKTGLVCLGEIKSNENLKQLPVVIYTGGFIAVNADLLYEKGAHYFVQKGNSESLQKALEFILGLIANKNMVRPSADNFIIKK